MSVYVYAGHHTGPDSFDAATDHRTARALNTVDPLFIAEREAGFAYWYGRGFTDKEVAEATGSHQKAVMKWRQKRGYANNWTQ